MTKTKRPTRGSGKGAGVKKTDTPNNHNTPAPEPEETASQQLTRIDAVNTAQSSNRTPKPKQATLLVKLVDDCEPFHDGNDVFVDIDHGDHRKTLALRPDFRSWLRKQYWITYESTPSEQALSEALGVIESIGLYDSEERRVHVRVAGHGGNVYLDLADRDWHIIEISAEGWRVMVNHAPVRFVRRKGMQPLPVPVEAGDLGDLRRFVNAAGDPFVLLSSWVVGALHPRGPYPVGVLQGEQGSAKSTAAKMMRSLIDPNETLLRLTPKDEQDILIAARNGWVVAFDNVSRLSDRLSDALCVVSTGGGLGKRKLWTDLDESLINVARPILLNSIGTVVTRGDLLDRAIVLELEPLTAFRDEHELWADFELARPHLLGGQLDAVSAALRGLSTVELGDRRLRMADFARWIVAAEPALPWKVGDFQVAYGGNRRGAADIVLDDPVVHALLRLLKKDGDLSATATDLLHDLTNVSEDHLVRSKDWPTGPRGLSNKLKRLAPFLRRTGVNVSLGKRKPGGNRNRLINIEQLGNFASRPSRSSPLGDFRDDRDAGRDDTAPHASRFNAIGDGRDDRDDEIPTYSMSEDDPEAVDPDLIEADLREHRPC